jgi:hypothetical protein
MDKRFLDKVVDQIVSETTIDYDEETIYYPFLPPSGFLLSSLYSPFVLYNFWQHCKNIYGLNEEEIIYVWEKYRKIIYKI